MSSALAISGVTAVIQYLLTNMYNDPTTPLGSVKVTAQAPDIVQNTLGTSSSSSLQVNVFLHQVTLNSAWRNVRLPSLAADGQTVLKNPPLALDLHYLLTAYGSQDTQAEALLGYAVQVLHVNPVLARSQITTALTHVPPSTNPLSAVLKTAGLDSQIEMIKITPATLGREEMAWLWTALKADYRPTFPFQASVVLILSPAATVSGLPVLKRHVRAVIGLQPPTPALSAVVPPASQPAACVGDLVTVQGSNLGGAATVELTNAPLQIDSTVAVSSPTATSLQFTVPSVPAGFYVLSVTVGTGTAAISTNSLPLMVAPKITAGVPATVPHGAATLTVSCTPDLQPGQDVSLLIGGQGAPVDPPVTAASSSASFVFAALQSTSPNSVPVWLRVDGVDGPTIDFTPPTPKYQAPMTQVT